MKISLKSVNTVTKRLKDGTIKTYHYHRGTGKRIDADPNTIAFARAHEAASEASEAIMPEGQFRGLIKTYKKSPEFRKLASSTQSNYNRQIDMLDMAFGHLSLRALSERKIRAPILAWRDEIALDKPAAADQVLKVFKLILAFAEDRVLIELNPLKGISKLSVTNRSDCIWTFAEVEKILEVSRIELQWVVKLALLTGQRISDLIKLKWAGIDGGILRLTQAKTLSKVGIPLNAPLLALLASIPQRAPTILTNSYGKPWASKEGVNWQWSEALKRASLWDTGRTFHDLRGTAVTCLADVGCTEAEIAAITGHSLEHVGRILKYYLKRTDAQAEAAMKKFETSWIGKL